MEKEILQLIERLAQERTFEGAAEAVLSAALDLTEDACARSPFAKTGRVLRAMVHFRPDDGYVRLVVLEASKRGSCAVGQADHVPSATAWRWVKEHAMAVAVDVLLGTVTPEHGRDLIGHSGHPRTFDAAQSRIKLQGRDVTHLYVAPLPTPGGRVDGMLAIEASCREAMGTTFVWETCGPTVRALTAIASQYLARLPVTRIEPTIPDRFLPVIGASMQGVVEMLRVFARQEETILLSGPTGAGKSRLARWCHSRSPVSDQVFETIDLATVPEELQMAELFGWKKGAFTGAAKDTPGCIARAENGTLFIDEVDKLSLKAQAGLLRVLEDKRYRPLGEGSGDRTASVRFIVGTNADLQALSQKGAFRADLYYRINVLPVRIPPLGDRTDEIVNWATYMLHRRHEASKVGGDATITRDAAQRLICYHWPGNLRQLDNIVRRAYALSFMDQEDPPERVVLRAGHIDRALMYEGGGTPSSMLDQLERAAEAFVIEAERRAESGEQKLDMDVADALKGLVIEAAKRRFGLDEKEALRRAFLLLGKEATVERRNHWAVYKREMERLREARRILGGRGDDPLPSGGDV